jgi:urease accessory protein
LSGGLTQDDRVTLRISTTGGAIAHVTTQAATKVHSMQRGFAMTANAVSKARRAQPPAEAGCTTS